MRLRSTLAQLAQLAILATTGCGGQTSSLATTDGGKEAGPVVGPDGGREPQEGGAPDAGELEAACGGCWCGSGPAVPSGNATPDQACAIAQDSVGQGQAYGTACQTFCAQLNGNGGYFCTVPQDYLDAYDSAQPDAGGSAEAGADGGLVCPAWPDAVIIQCGYNCTGRRTLGVADAVPCDGASVGKILAERAYLEAVSVHAFATLERELAAHGAPAELLRDVRRARRDEVRHTAMMTRLARRFDGSPRGFAAPPPSPVRGLLAIALENAVEGCVRETYGAVVGLVEAQTSADADVRRAMQSIAADECRHAELAWDVAAWLLPRLTPGEREAVARATRDAVAALDREAAPGIVRLLAERVWSVEAGQALSA